MSLIKNCKKKKRSTSLTVLVYIDKLCMFDFFPLFIKIIVNIKVLSVGARKNLNIVFIIPTKKENG